MSRDIEDRLNTFRVDLEVRRLALNMDQVEHFNLPPNPTKLSDSRAQAYIALYDEDSWELDALEPAEIAALIRQQVLELRDEDAWVLAAGDEEAAKRDLGKVADKWDEVLESLNEE